MKKTYATSMPDHIGAFLKASRCFAELGINITRVSYDKAVDAHMLFLDVEGDAEQLRRADIELELQMLTDSEDADKYERMAMLRSKAMQLDAEIARLQAQPKPVLTMEHLARIIEMWTKIPASKIQAQEFTQLRQLGEKLN